MEKFLEKANKPILYVILIIGILMLGFGSFLFPEQKKVEIKETGEVRGETQLERRLEDILSETYSNVSVMITFAEGQEVVPAAETKISDKRLEEGGRIEQINDREEKPTIINDGGYNRILTLKTLYPKAQGAIITVDGGDDIRVCEEITKAVGAVLNIPVHNIVVLPSRK